MDASKLAQPNPLGLTPYEMQRAARIKMIQDKMSGLIQVSA